MHGSLCGFYEFTLCSFRFVSRLFYFLFDCINCPCLSLFPSLCSFLLWLLLLSPLFLIYICMYICLACLCCWRNHHAKPLAETRCISVWRLVAAFTRSWLCGIGGRNDRIFCLAVEVIALQSRFCRHSVLLQERYCNVWWPLIARSKCCLKHQNLTQQNQHIFATHIFSWGMTCLQISRVCSSIQICNIWLYTCIVHLYNQCPNFSNTTCRTHAVSGVLHCKWIAGSQQSLFRDNNS